MPKTDRWACEKADIMREILLLKAKQVPEFRQTLQETGCTWHTMFLMSSGAQAGQEAVKT